MSRERELQERVAEAEAIIAAMWRKMRAMYNSDLEALWPREADELEAAYARKYGVNLDPRDTETD